MDIGVLGPLHVSFNGMTGQILLAPKPRTVLAVLLTNAGTVVPVSSLVREVWGDAPPASASRNIQTYIFQCRKVFAQVTRVSVRAVARDLLMTKPGGYMFSDASNRFDHEDFRRLVLEGRDAVRCDDFMRGISLLGHALGRWRGPAFVDVATGVTLEAQRRQLEGFRVGAIEMLSSAKIAVGRYHEAAADLAIAVYEHPLHEGLHYQYMRALSLAGDRAHALDVFSRLRMNLVAELGIEPGAAVQELQGKILNSSGGGHAAPYPPSTGRMTPVV